jgi:hypothetical protein
MSDNEKKQEPVEKCICGKEGCNLECDPIKFEDEDDGKCHEPSCFIS